MTPPPSPVITPDPEAGALAPLLAVLGRDAFRDWNPDTTGDPAAEDVFGDADPLMLPLALRLAEALRLLLLLEDLEEAESLAAASPASSAAAIPRNVRVRNCCSCADRSGRLPAPTTS